MCVALLFGWATAHRHDGGRSPDLHGRL